MRTAYSISLLKPDRILWTCTVAPISLQNCSQTDQSANALTIVLLFYYNQTSYKSNPLPGQIHRFHLPLNFTLLLASPTS